jgi:hypothetical protein
MGTTTNRIPLPGNTRDPAHFECYCGDARRIAANATVQVTRAAEAGRQMDLDQRGEMWPRYGTTPPRLQKALSLRGANRRPEGCRSQCRRRAGKRGYRGV